MSPDDQRPCTVCGTPKWRPTHAEWCERVTHYLEIVNRSPGEKGGLVHNHGLKEGERIYQERIEKALRGTRSPG